MAKIIAEFDTVEKTFNVSVDGEQVQNCTDAVFCGYGDNTGYVELRKVEFNEEQKMATITRICANEITHRDDNLSQDIASKLFPRRVK